MLVVKVDGISCGHCVSTITQALADLDKAAKIQIDKSTQTVRFEGRADKEEVTAAIQEAGYDVIETTTV